MLAGARTRERTNLRCRTMSPGWRYGALVSHSKLAIRAYVDQTKLYQLGIYNIKPEQRATGPLARSECDAPVLRAGPQYRGTVALSDSVENDWVVLWGFKNLLMRFKAYVLYKMRGYFACSYQDGEKFWCTNVNCLTKTLRSPPCGTFQLISSHPLTFST